MGRAQALGAIVLSGLVAGFAVLAGGAAAERVGGAGGRRSEVAEVAPSACVPRSNRPPDDGLMSVFSQGLVQIESDADPVPGALRLPRSAMPRLDPDAKAVHLDAIYRDDSIGLLRLRAGTDQDDYRLEGGPDDRIVLRESGVVTVHGNLWTDAEPKALVLQAEADVTLRVLGNLYVQRSILMEGPGLVAFVCEAGDGPVFADADGDGSRGDEEVVLGSGAGLAGPSEGRGACYLGIEEEAGVGGCRELRVGAMLLVGGQLHLRAKKSVLQGGLVLAHGVTEVGVRGAELATSGHRPPASNPVGFQPWGEAVTHPGETLYLATPPR